MHAAAAYALNSRALASLLLLVTLLASAPASAKQGLLPRPASLRPAVQFWTRVYTQITTEEGYVHDDRDLKIIYETLHFSAGSSPADQERVIHQTLVRYREALLRIAHHHRRKGTAEEHRVLALWGKRASARTLRQAAERLRFQRGQADRFRAGMERAEAWKERIRATLAAFGLPSALAALPHVESSYNPTVRSHAGAVGLWQITEPTGRLLLRVDEVLDERLDPLRATEAAARFLKQNYQVLKSWPLAITAYNHGLGGVRRAVEETGSSNIGTIVRRYDGPRFGFASRNFYASFLAALDVSSHPGRYFKGLGPQAAPKDLNTLGLTAYFPMRVLCKRLDLHPQDLRPLNPALGPAVWSGRKYIPKGYRLRLPDGVDAESLRRRLRGISASDGQAQQRPDLEYRVRQGDTLSEIAARYGTDTATLAAMNHLSRPDRISAGRVLRLPPRPPLDEPVSLASVGSERGSGPALATAVATE
jgi:peptidoglycan lytic transglycosylase D